MIIYRTVFKLETHYYANGTTYRTVRKFEDGASVLKWFDFQF